MMVWVGGMCDLVATLDPDVSRVSVLQFDGRAWLAIVVQVVEGDAETAGVRIVPEGVVDSHTYAEFHVT